jgi:hypothetical protein
MYFDIADLEFGSAWSRLLRFQVSKPQVATEVAFATLTTLAITQEMSVLCRLSSWHGECEITVLLPAVAKTAKPNALNLHDVPLKVL